MISKDKRVLSCLKNVASSIKTSFKPNDEQENKDYREEALPIPASDWSIKTLLCLVDDRVLMELIHATNL